jgi:O-antigen/teichoic acid export membrane protein
MTNQLPDPASDSQKKSFGVDVGKLVSGTIVAQIVGICLTPLITRIFNPEIYGVAAIFTSIVSIIVVIACMRYELAILLPKEDKDAGALFLACLLILICVNIASLLVIWLFGDTIIRILNVPALKDYLFLVPLAVLIDGLYLALRYWNTRRRRFGSQATTQALQSVSASGLKLGFGALGYVNACSLIVGQILGHGLGALGLLFQVLRYDLLIIKSGCSKRQILDQIIRYKKFPQFNIWAAFMNTISWQLPVLMLTSFFSIEIAGFYALGLMMIQMPMNFIGASISQVFLHRFSVTKENYLLSELAGDTCSTLIILSVLPFILLSLVGGDLFGIIFGPEWLEAGVYVQILGFWAFVWFITSPLTTISIVLEKQEINLVYNIIILITRFVSLLIGGIYANVYLALFLFSVSGVVVYGSIGYLCVIVWAKASIRTIWKQIKQPIFVSIVLTIIALVVTLLPLSSLLTCGIAILIGLIYLFYIMKTQPLLRAYLGW